MVMIPQKIKLGFNNCDIYYLEHNNNLKNNLKMKKIFYVMAAFVAISFASCGEKTEVGCTNDSDSVAVDTLVVDSVATDTAVADTVLAE